MPRPLSQVLDDENDRDTLASSAPSKRDRLKRLGRHMKSAPKRLLMRVDDATSTETPLDGDGKVVKGVTDNPSFDTAMIEPKEHTAVGNAILNTVSLAKNAAQIVIHPQQHSKTKGAAKFTASENPYLEENADVKLLAAHDELERAKPVDDDDSVGWDLFKEKKEEVEEIQHEREAARNAWITGKHVKRVRVVPTKFVDYPRTSQFREYGEDGRYVRWQWERYIGHMLLFYCQDFIGGRIDDTNEMPFKRGTVKHHAERLLVASSIWQVYFMHVRKVYLWQDPTLTLRWLVTFLVVLETGYILTSFYLWIVYIVIRNRVMNDDLRFVREAQARAKDKEAQAQSLSELVDRLGHDQWIDSVLDELGPLIQQQLGDLADFLEILSNFYSWRDPRATIYTLTVWIAAALLAGFTSTDFGKRIIFFGVGLYFFCARPVASLYPKYRKIMSLFRYMFWDVPTHAELAFQELRQKAQSARAATIERRIEKKAEGEAKIRASENGQIVSNIQPSTTHISKSSTHLSQTLTSTSYTSDSDTDSDTSIISNTDFLSFRGRYESYNGRLIITSTGLRFIRSLSTKNTLRHASLLFRKKPAPNPDENPNAASDEESYGPSEQLFTHPFTSLVELRKSRTGTVSVTRRKKILQTDALVIVWADGSEAWVDSMPKRDEAFNCIIGFSGLKFRSLQPDMGEAGVDGDGIGRDGKGKRDRHDAGVFEEVGKI